MKDKIIEEILNCANNKVYSTLFGTQSIDILKELNINWIIRKDLDLIEQIQLIMTHIMSEVLKEYEKYDEYSDKIFIESNNELIKFESVFSDNKYRFDIMTKFADLENYISDIDVIESGLQLVIQIKFPIYKI